MLQRWLVRGPIAIAVSAWLATAAFAGDRAHPYFDDQGTLVWYETLGEAKSAARAQNKAIFVECGRRRCTQCRKLCSQVLPDARVRERGSRLLVGLSVNCDTADGSIMPLLRSNLPGATTLPLVGFLRADGRWITGFAGSRSVAEFAGDLTTVERTLAAERQVRPTPAVAAVVRQPVSAPALPSRARPGAAGDLMTVQPVRAERHVLADPASTPAVALPPPPVPPTLAIRVTPEPAAAAVRIEPALAERQVVATPVSPPVASLPPPPPPPTLTIRVRPEEPAEPVTAARALPERRAPAVAAATPAVPAPPPPAPPPLTPRMQAEAAARSGAWDEVVRLCREAGPDDVAMATLMDRARTWAESRLNAAVTVAAARRYGEAVVILEYVRTAMAAEPEAQEAQRGLDAVRRAKQIHELDVAEAAHVARRHAHEDASGTRWARLFV